jgi:hypothetical protein
MSAPTEHTIAADQYTLVATGVQTAWVEILRDTVEHMYAWVDTGDAAPTAKGDATGFDKRADVRSSRPIDVYIWAISAEGKVRVHA